MFRLYNPNRFRFQQARLDFAFNGLLLTLFTMVGEVSFAFLLEASKTLRCSVTLPLLGVCATTALGMIFLPWLKKIEMPRRDRYVVLAACLGVSVLPPLMASFADAIWLIVFWMFCCLGLFAWLMWYLGGRPPIRSEVEGLLAYGEAIVAESKTALEAIEREQPSTDAEKERAAELERIKKARDERLAVLEEAMRDSDEPLDPVTASAQFQQIQTEYREALEKIS